MADNKRVNPMAVASEDIERDIKVCFEDGSTLVEIAKRFNLTEDTVREIVK